MAKKKTLKLYVNIKQIYNLDIVKNVPKEKNDPLAYKQKKGCKTYANF